MKLGAKQLPVVMKQSTLNKCIREVRGSRSAHDLKRESIEQLPEVLNSPAVLINNQVSGKLALLSNETNQQGEPLLLAMELHKKVQDKEVNQITSFYGRSHCREYFERQQDAVIVDMKKAKKLSRLLGLQLPTTWKTLDGDILPQMQTNVKENIKNDICNDICKSGFCPTKSLADNIYNLNRITGQIHKMKDISMIYKQGCIGISEEEKGLIQEIAKECSRQEQQMAEQLAPEP